MVHKSTTFGPKLYYLACREHASDERGAGDGRDQAGTGMRTGTVPGRVYRDSARTGNHCQDGYIMVQTAL